MQNQTKFRIGVVGAGLIARDHLLSLGQLEQVASLAVFDAEPERATRLAQEFNAAHCASLAELVEASDVVWICTPPFVRREPIAAACRAKRAIFCEKPLALNAAEAAWIEATVREAGVPFFMGQSNRFLSVFRKIKALVESDAIGTPTTVWSSRFGWIDAGSTPAWRLDDEKGGGVVIELGVHEIDFCRWIGGDWQSLYARDSSLILAPGRFQESVCAMGVLSGGVTARLDVSWASPRYLWQRGVEGTEGSLFFDDAHIERVELHRPGREPEMFPVGGWQDESTGENLSLREQAQSVLQVLASGSEPPVTVRDGAAALRVALAIRESARTGRVVQVEKF